MCEFFPVALPTVVLLLAAIKAGWSLVFVSEYRLISKIKVSRPIGTFNAELHTQVSLELGVHDAFPLEPYLCMLN